MLMRSQAGLLLAAAVLAGCGSHRGASHRSPFQSTEENVGRVLHLKEYGVIVTEVNVTRDMKPACSLAYFKVKRTGGSALMSEDSGNLGTLEPGDYTAETIVCLSPPNKVTNIAGPHFRFSVQAGELVDIGEYRMDFSADGLLIQQGRVRRAVKELGPDALAKLQRDIPQLLPQMTKRPMQIVGPTEYGIKTKIF